jgi:hypothetical protein
LHSQKRKNRKELQTTGFCNSKPVKKGYNQKLKKRSMRPSGIQEPFAL